MYYILIFAFICGVYFAFISPCIYRWWIIPNIEKRYRKKLVFSYPSYQFELISGAHLEVASYIVFALFGYNNIFKNRYEALYKINYDIKTAPMIEIIVSIITVGSGLLFLVIVFFQYFYYS